MFSRGAKVVAALLGGAALSLAVPMLPAVGQGSPPVAGVRLSSPAKVADGGAVAFVPVLIACPAGAQPFVQVQLTERSGHLIAQGFGNTFNVVCTGGIQQVVVAVTPSNAPFVAGVAFGRANISVCSPFDGCSSGFDQRNVKLVVKHKPV
ncbi:MAG: hypothetical protein M3083_04235 [Actinomycetota bacterium]|nr:hypothetical protein [Actinomycetota bacterium]